MEVNTEWGAGKVTDNFPDDVSAAIEEIAEGNEFYIKKETHYEALNRVLEWFEANKLYRLDISYLNNESCLKTTCYVDEFNYPKILFKIFNWCHDYIPNFPYMAKIKWKDLGNIPLHLGKEEYKKILSSYIEAINNGVIFGVK